MKNLKFPLIILSLIIVASCKFTVNPKAPSQHFVTSLQNASPDFQKGWSDGCESGMNAGSSSFYQMFYRSNKQDGFKMATSPEYSDAWDKAWWYCTHSNYVDMKSSVWGSLFSGYQ
jgi:hypothetical protein